MTQSALSWLDWVIVAVIGASALVSLIRGFIREAMSLVVWVLAIWLAFHYVDEVQVLLEGHIELPSARTAVAFSGIFIAVLAVGGLATFLISKLVESTGLSSTDRLLGMIFGALRGVALVVLFVLVAGLTPMPKDPWWQNSTLVGHFERLAEWASDYLPESVKDYVEYPNTIPLLPENILPTPDKTKT
ncbi:MAG: CvpA family protein [bacterium]